MRWEGGKGGRLVRWEGGEGGRLLRWQCGRKSWELPGFFKGGGHKTSSRFHLFVSDVNLGNKGGGMGSRFSCVATGMERLSLDLLQAVKNIARCGSVWNL